MLRVRYNQGWSRPGFALLWDADVLAGRASPGAVLSVRQFYGLVDDWPDELPAAEGDALIGAGVEGCFDVLSGEDAAQWLETDLREAVFSFRDFYEGQAGLIPHPRTSISACSESCSNFVWSG
jgi:hypothetical protein